MSRPERSRRRAGLTLAAGFVAAGIGVATLFAGARVPEPSGGDAVVFRDVNVVPMDSNRILPHRTVLVRDGRISRVVPAERGSEIGGADLVVEGRGRYLMPGLHDTHVHVSDDAHLTLYVANGVTSVANLGGDRERLDLRRRIDAGEVLGPRFFTCGPLVRGAESPSEAERIAREQAEAGYDCIKVYGSSWTRESYERLVEAGQTLGLIVLGHAPRNLPFRAVLESGQDAIVHLEEIVYTHPPFAEFFQPYWSGTKSPDQLPDVARALAGSIESLAREVRESDLWVTPSLIAFDLIWRQRTEEFDDLMARPYTRYLSPMTVLSWRSYRAAVLRGGSTRVTRANLDLQKALLRAFHRAGVKLMLGTDATNPPTMPGFSVHQELALLTEAGLSPYQALRAGTVMPSRFFGVADEVGTIAVGKRADLVLVADNPLEDVAAAHRVEGVVVAGRWLSRGELDRRLDALRASYAGLRGRIAEFDRALEDGGVAAALRVYEVTPVDDEFAGYVEARINTRGYELLGAGRVQAAIEVFRANARAFPRSANVWDSLGEAYMVDGQDGEAIEFYRKSLELNPGNNNARRMIERIRERSEPGA